MLEGTVVAGGEPVAGAVVLLCTGDGERALAGAETVADGAFRLYAPEPPVAAGLLVTARGPILSGGWWTLDSIEGPLELPGPLHLLAIRLSQPPPRSAEAWVEPLSLPSVPDTHTRLLLWRSPTLIDFRFAAHALGDPPVEFRAAPGTYSVGAEVPVPDGPQLDEGDVRGMQAAAARADGVPLEPYGANGFRAEIAGDLEIEIDLRESAPPT